MKLEIETIRPKNEPPPSTPHGAIKINTLFMGTVGAFKGLFLRTFMDTVVHLADVNGKAVDACAIHNDDGTSIIVTDYTPVKSARLVVEL
jgi:hypothetical protein